MSNSEVVQNQTGAEMISELSRLDGVLAIDGLTPDARTPIEAKRGEVHTKFARAAEYAVALANETGVIFDNPLNGVVHAETTTPNVEVLNPEEVAYKEAVLEGFGVSHKTYTSVMDAMNGTKAREANNSKLAIATETEAKTALEALLTPTMIRSEMAQIAEFTANPEANSPEPGFDTLFVANENLTAEDETALANHLQAKLTAYKGEAYLYETLHNANTAHDASGSDAKVQAVRVPKHLNVRAGVVADQKAAVEAYNLNPDNDIMLVMADDLTAMTHIAHQIATGAIDATNPQYDKKRFWSTYYKNVLADPSTDGYVLGVCVGDGGQLARGSASVHFDDPSRALVVPKV